MAYRLACDLSGEIAAIAPVAGSIPEPLLASCWPSRPVSVVAINGVDDPLVPWQGGPVHIGRWERGNVLSVAETIAFWVDHDRCSLRPVITYAPDSDPLDGTRVRREAYEDCQGGAEVVLYAVEGGGHTWPGGRQYLPEPIVGRTSRDADANQLIWAFFMAHRMR